MSGLNGVVVGMSFLFSIQPLSIAVTAPDPNATSPIVWHIDKDRQIKWTQNLPAGSKVRLEVSRDGGASWAQIAPDTLASDGSYTWTVTGPATATDQAMIRATSVDFGVNGRSALFTIK